MSEFRRSNPGSPGASPPSSGADRVGAVDLALESDPRHAGIGLAGDASGLARWEPAASIADSALEGGLAPDDAEFHNSRGAARYARGDWAGAIADFDRAVAIEPRHVEAHANRGVARHAFGDLEGAIADLDRALALDPRHAEAYYNRGLVRHVRDDLEGAIADFDRALRIDARNVQAYIARGGSRYHAGDPEAHVDYWMALLIDPRVAATKVVRKLAADLRRDPVAVLANCARHLRRGPGDIVAHARRGLSLLLLGRDGEAEEDLAQVLLRGPEWTGRLDRLIAEAKQQRATIPTPGAHPRLADWHPSRPKAGPLATSGD